MKIFKNNFLGNLALSGLLIGFFNGELVFAFSMDCTRGIGPMDTPCLGLDGIPIIDAALLTKCCGTGNTVTASGDPTCVGGGISDTGQNQLSYTWQMNNQAIKVIQQVNDITGGNASAVALAAAKNSAGAGANAAKADSAAMLSGGSGNTGSGASNGMGAGAGSGASGFGANGGSGGGAGGSGGGSGLGSAGNTTGVAPDAAAATDGGDGSGKDGRLAYVENSAREKGAAGSGSGSGSGKVGVNVGDDLKFGNGAVGIANGGFGTNGANGASEDGPEGVAEDPSDYLTRIDKSASIFKVMSSAYIRKKSLWRAGEGAVNQKKQ